MKACSLFYDELFKPPYPLVFGELCLFPVGAIYVEEFCPHYRQKLMSHTHDINSLLLTIRMGSKRSTVRHLFKTQNVLVLRNTGINDG